ncbi:hypothetical protein N9C07_07160 [Flavobacteriaceae bacterium]|nr:hypothetical protein [Flavobacteriaceae bacterium]MDC1543869.1 hypothetical protein [Flavobacteriaceae bacterium]
MKKGLLSILASALLVVGCQNYDDQFTNLESQISALASTVAGLSQVQSDLSSLAGTVGSLTSTISGLGSTIDTAVADGLADIQADITAIEAAVADVASSEEVSDLSDAVAASQDDLDELLANSSVFTGDVTVNSPALLDAFLAMGSALNIVNGNVDITVSTAMDQTKVQTLVDNMLTIVKDLTYTSAASTIAETTFDNLTGVQSITITQGGGIRFPNLISATTIDMKDDFESTVDVIHFGSLTSVNAFETDGVADVIEFNKATELHLTALAYYPSGSLTIVTDEGAAMPFALDDIDADGDTLEDGLTLDITGPASFAVSNIADGSITLTDVATVNLTDFNGSVTIAGDVLSLTSNSLVNLTITTGTSLETLDVTGVSDPDAEDADDADWYGPAIALASLSDLESATIAGKVASVSVSSNGNLTDLTISATVADAISVSENSDLTGLTVTGATASGISVDDNSDLETLSIDLTFAAGTATSAVIDGSVSITDNESLESLTVSSDKIETLTITGNDDLTTLDFTGVEAIGATGEAVVNIFDNDLTASSMTDSDDGTTDVANGGSGDLGSITTTSGIGTLSTYFAAVDADADSTATVYFDTVDSFTDEDDAETTDHVYDSTLTTQVDPIVVLLLSASSGDAVAAKGEIAATRAWIADLSVGGDIAFFDNNGAELFSNGTLATGVASLTLDANKDLTISAIMTDANVDRFAAYDITLDAIRGGNSIGSVALSTYASGATSATTVVGQRYTTGAAIAAAATSTNYGVGVDDLFTLTVGGNSVTTSITTGTATTTANIVTNVVAAWAAKYGASGTASASAVATITANTSTIDIVSLDKGSSGYGLAIDFSVAAGTVTSTTAANVDYVVGATTDEDDDATVDQDVIIKLTSTSAGTAINYVSGVTTTTANANALVELVSTKLTNGTDTTDVYTEAQEARSDVVLAEGSAAAVAATTAATSFSRVGWL